MWQQKSQGSYHAFLYKIQYRPDSILDQPFLGTLAVLFPTPLHEINSFTFKPKDGPELLTEVLFSKEITLSLQDLHQIQHFNAFLFSQVFLNEQACDIFDIQHESFLFAPLNGAEQINMDFVLERIQDAQSDGWQTSRPCINYSDRNDLQSIVLYNQIPYRIEQI